MSSTRHPIATWQNKLGNFLRSPLFSAAMKRLELFFRLGFRWGITPIFVGVAVCMMSGVASYWFTLVQPAWEHPRWSATWCLNTIMGVWLLFNVGWNYFRCMFTPSYRPLPLDKFGNEKRKGDCASVLSLCCCSSDTVTSKHSYASVKTEERTSVTIPSSPNSQSAAHHRHDSSSDEAVMMTQSKEERDVDAWNFCKRCDQITPPRAMHCFLCNRCVLGMDHHCPWLATCIGYHNHAYFFLFLFYVVVGCAYLCTWTIPMFYSIVINKNYRTWQGVDIHRDRFALTLLGVLPFTFIFAVGGMMVWHGIILACGATSLEFKIVIDWLQDSFGGYKIFSCCQRSSEPSNNVRAGKSNMLLRRRHPFDQGGLVANWRETFGVRDQKLWWILWCLPITHERSGNGVDKFLCETPSNNGRYTMLTV